MQQQNSTLKMVQVMSKLTRIIAALGLSFCCGSCESFLNVEVPASKIPKDRVFKDDNVATSAVVGIYLDMYNLSAFAGGGESSVAVLAGLSARELRNNSTNEPLFVEFQTSQISTPNQKLLPLWNTMYKTVYECNAVLEGLSASVNLTAATSQQLRGEALFIRGFTYFYLTNLFGSVPLALTTDYKINSTLDRSPDTEVYDQIVHDLTEAESLLSVSYPTKDRIRVNKAAATALLARVYLYLKDWARAEERATALITNSAQYVLADSLNDVFLAGSKEAIWQLRPSDGAAYTNEGAYFSVIEAPKSNVLDELILPGIEQGDRRLKNWITSVSYLGNTILLPFKYKRYTLGSLTNEYSMVLRLAEMYLIRAEARIMQDKLPLAIADLNKIRVRAKLKPFEQLISNPTQPDVINAIEQERRMEFLAEWGHRWLDLKRWNRADEFLGPINETWTETDVLYPIPQQEISKNINLTPQNPGY